MKRSKFYFAVISFLVLIFSVLFSFVIDKKLPIYDHYLYVIVKLVVTVTILVLILVSLVKTNDPANNLIVNIASLIFLFLPLLVRYMITREKPNILWTYVVSFLVLLIYLGIVFSVDVLNKKVNKVAPKLVGKEIPLQDESSYYDKDGNFVSAKNGGNKE